MSWKIDTNTPLRKGDMVKCINCGKNHPVKCGTINGKVSNEMMYITCPKNKTTILVGMNGCKIEKVTEENPVVRISNMISKLQELMDQYGDIPVKYAYDGPDASCNMAVKYVLVEIKHNPEEVIALIQ